VILRAGDEMKCWRCSGWHVLEASRYATWMLFVTCGGSTYYAGGVGIMSDQPTAVSPPEESAASAGTADR
jgi:hypothetical protein